MFNVIHMLSISIAINTGVPCPVDISTLNSNDVRIGKNSCVSECGISFRSGAECIKSEIEAWLCKAGAERETYSLSMHIQGESLQIVAETRSPIPEGKVFFNFDMNCRYLNSY